MQLVQRLQLDDGSAVIAPHPERHRRRPTVDEHPADVRRPGEQVFGELAGLRIEPQNAIGQHGARPRLAVLVVRDVVGRRPRRRRGPLLERLRARVEHGDPVAAVLAEPETVLGVHHAPARGRARRRRREERDLPGPGVDAPDVLLGEVSEERVVLRVGDDVVDVVVLSLRPVLERLERLELARRQIEAVPARGSRLPSVCSPKFGYQAMPSGSRMTSCGSMVGRGRSYSVMTTRVPRPTGRGSVFNAYSQRGAELRLIEARNSACSRRKRSRSSPRISSWRSASRSWGWSGVLWFAYLPMRGSTC